MKLILVALVILTASIHASIAKPGGTYILTGQEKSIDEIVKKDVDMFPDLYQGENIKFYVAKFKSENKIGRRKLSPGDQLVFPATEASVTAEKGLFKQKLIGKWSTQTSNSSTITEYKEDGTLIMNYLKVINFEGTWEIKDEHLHIKLITTVSNSGVRTKAVKFEKIDRKKIIKITEDELHTQIHGKEIIIEKRIQ